MWAVVPWSIWRVSCSTSPPCSSHWMYTSGGRDSPFCHRERRAEGLFGRYWPPPFLACTIVVLVLQPLQRCIHSLQVQWWCMGNGSFGALWTWHKLQSWEKLLPWTITPITAWLAGWQNSWNGSPKDSISEICISKLSTYLFTTGLSEAVSH